MIKNYQLFLESKKDKFPNIKTVKVGDFTVLIGKDSKSKDYLTTIKSQDEDIWFHAKGVPGSHVVIKSRESLPTPEIIEEVARIAAKNSKSTGKTKVVYCKIKFVNKTSDMKEGQVSVDYNNADEIEVEI